MWTLPALIVITSVVLSIPCGFYLARIADGRLRVFGWLRWIESRVDTGPQSWKQYTLSLLLFNTVLFVFGFAVLALQPFLPFAPAGKGMLAPTTIFNSVTSFFTNTDLQDYAGEQHLSYFSQIAFVVANMFLSASVGFCALAAVVRGLRGDAHMGNYYVDMWRIVAYVFFPASLVMGVLLMAQGVPMTFEPSAKVATLEAGAMGTRRFRCRQTQEIARGPVAAVIPDQAPGDQRRRFLRSQLGPPLREPRRLDQLPLVHEHSDLPVRARDHVRPHVEESAARGHPLRHDDGPVPGRRSDGPSIGTRCSPTLR